MHRQDVVGPSTCWLLFWALPVPLSFAHSLAAFWTPPLRRYDPHKTLKQNLNLTPAIMSRFDLFFVVMDKKDQALDRSIAHHIVSLHQHGSIAKTEVRTVPPSAQPPSAEAVPLHPCPRALG
jgi:hypothetical protein